MINRVEIARFNTIIVLLLLFAALFRYCRCGHRLRLLFVGVRSLLVQLQHRCRGSTVAGRRRQRCLGSFGHPGRSGRLRFLALLVVVGVLESLEIFVFVDVEVEVDVLVVHLGLLRHVATCRLHGLVVVELAADQHLLPQLGELSLIRHLSSLLIIQVQIFYL